MAVYTFDEAACLATKAENAKLAQENRELRAAADLLARVRDGCTANDTSAFSSDPKKGYLLIRGPHSILRELAEALGEKP